MSLHLISKFVASDTRFQFGILLPNLLVPLVELLEEIKGQTLLTGVDMSRLGQVGKWFPLEFHRGALKRRGHEP